MSRRVLTGAFVLLLAAPAVSAVAGYAWLSTPPTAGRLPIPVGQIALDTPEGQALLAGATARADHTALFASMQSQEKRSWCGVASAATVLSAARGARMTQDAFFTDGTDAVRSRLRVTFGGMALDELAGMLAAHGAEPRVTHAGESTVGAFREAAARNLATAGDWLVVNYSRGALGQGDGGHLSPVSAYDAASDRFLVLDVATYKFPPLWIGAEALHAAMATTDPDTGRTRGWIEIRGAPR